MGGVRLRLSTVYGDIPGAAEGTDLGGAHRAGAALARPPEWMSSPRPALSRRRRAGRAAPGSGRRAGRFRLPGPRRTTRAVANRTEPAIPPAAPRAADGPRYRVQLGAFSRPAVARRARTALAGALEDVLAGGGRALVVDDSRGDGLSRVVLADSFAGRRAAAAVCAEIAARGRECYVCPRAIAGADTMNDRLRDLIEASAPLWAGRGRGSPDLFLLARAQRGHRPGLAQAAVLQGVLRLGLRRAGARHAGRVGPRDHRATPGAR